MTQATATAPLTWTGAGFTLTVEPVTGGHALYTRHTGGHRIDALCFTHQSETLVRDVARTIAVNVKATDGLMSGAARIDAARAAVVRWVDGELGYVTASPTVEDTYRSVELSRIRERFEPSDAKTWADGKAAEVIAHLTAVWGNSEAPAELPAPDVTDESPARSGLDAYVAGTPNRVTLPDRTRRTQSERMAAMRAELDTNGRVDLTTADGHDHRTAWALVKRGYADPVKRTNVKAGQRTLAAIVRAGANGVAA